MDKKTRGLIATIATVFFCGLPGLCLCLFGGITAAGVMPYNTDINGVVNNGVLPSGYGFAMLCLAIIMIFIPAGVGFFTLRKKSDDNAVDAVPVADAHLESAPFKNDASSAPPPPPSTESNPFDDDEPLPPPS